MARKRIFFICAVCFLISIISVFAEESLTITTYYPSPYGSYRELSWGNYPNSRGKLTADQGASIELGGSGTPYIDFSNDMASDHDFRLILNGNDDFWISGGQTTFANDNGTPAVIRVGDITLNGISIQSLVP